MEIIAVIQIILSILLVIAILLQQSEAGIGGALGGDLGSSGHHTRRGFEKMLFRASIFLAILFALTAVFALLV